MNNRRFLNLIVQDVNTRVNSLHLVDPWKHLFHPPASTDAKPEKKKGGASADRLRLHKPQFRFEPNPHARRRLILESHTYAYDTPRFRYQSNLHANNPTPTTTTHNYSFFSALFRENNLLLADSGTDDGAFLYDVDLHSQMGIPSMYLPKGPDCVCFSAPQRRKNYMLSGTDTHCFYVLNLSPPPDAIANPSTFEVLTYYRKDMGAQPQLGPSYKNSFYWRTLPPPFPCRARASIDTCSFMMVDDGSTSTIAVSSAEKGTYTFDMATAEWTQDGDWVLPFYGKAEHVPELGLSFALTADSSSLHPHRRRLCAFHPSGAGLPTLRHTFDDDYLNLPDKWAPYKCRLLNLGSGSFCIVSFCKTTKGRELAVLTGVEVKPCEDGQLRMIRHMSKRISLGSHSIISCVL